LGNALVVAREQTHHSSWTKRSGAPRLTKLDRSPRILAVEID
jgi:hypothetical protein